MSGLEGKNLYRLAREKVTLGLQAQSSCCMARKESTRTAKFQKKELPQSGLQGKLCIPKSEQEEPELSGLMNKCALSGLTINPLHCRARKGNKFYRTACKTQRIYRLTL